MKGSHELEAQAVWQVAQLMAAAARTAPKTRGVDNVVVLAVDDAPTRERIVQKMRDIAQERGLPSLDRDARSIEACPLLRSFDRKA
jgi:uncharacterized ferredoxin-like protein